MATGGGATSKGGHDHEFVTPPPKTLECPVCLLTLCDPHIISCCGNEFCKVCIERVQRDGKPCPLCNEPNFTTMLNKKLAREINALVIRCPYKELGCKWQGELSQVCRHLNQASPTGCDYVTVMCKYQCGTEMQRHLIHHHEIDDCSKRPVEMQVVSLTQKFDVMITNNKLLCQELEEMKQSQHKMRAENDELQHTLKVIKEQNEDLKQKYDGIKRELEVLKVDHTKYKTTSKQKFATLETRKLSLPVPPFYFDLSNIDHFMKTDYHWLSDSFYSHAGGYKLGVSVYPNGFGEAKGTHLSMFVHIRRGEFDEKLNWPFDGEIVIQAFSERLNRWTNDTTIVMKKGHVDEDIIERPLDLCNVEWGYSKYISHSKLRDEYCTGETKTSFRVTSVKLYH